VDERGVWGMGEGGVLAQILERAGLEGRRSAVRGMYTRYAYSVEVSLQYRTLDSHIMHQENYRSVRNDPMIV
jgi:hypothetical protein